MKKKLYITLNIILTLVIAQLVGCTTEDDFLPSTGTPSSNEISFELNIPGHKIPHISRSVVYDENSVETLDIILFGPAEQGTRKFKRHERITEYITGTVGKLSFKHKFLPEEAGWEIVFVTNASDQVSALNENDTKLTALEKLNITHETKWDIQNTPIPMYGEITLKESDIQPGKKVEAIDLVRMLARIDVKVNPDIFNFTLDQVYLFNRSTQGYISTQWDYKGNVNKGKVTEPNLSPYFSFADDQSKSNSILENDIHIAYPADPENNNCVGRIYTFEAEGKAYNDQSETATTLVIKGYLDNDQTKAHYYRIDFTDNKGKYMPLLRNYQYVVEITAVNGIGYSTLKEALTSYTVVSNLHIRTIVWDNEMLSDINFNGQYMLGVQFEEMIFSSKGNTSENFIATDYGNGITLVEKPDWVIINGLTDGMTEAFINISVEANPYTVIREGEIKLQAGRITHSIKVKQNKKSDRSKSVVNIACVPGIGFLGNNDGGASAAIAIRKVLDTHFKMGGEVELQEIKYHSIPNNPTVTPAFLSDKNVVFLTYAAIPSKVTLDLIRNWLEASPHRVLVISFDSNGTNPEAFKLQYFKDDITSIKWSHTNSDYYNDLVHTPGTEYFWKDGPFTKGEPIESATYINSDGTFGAATLPSSSKVLPIFESNGAMVFGINPEKRIVYIGDSQYGEAQTSSNYQGHRFNNNLGKVNNNVEKIFANLWAWVIDEVVLGEE